MQLILAWAAVALVLVAPYPTTAWLLQQSSLPAGKWLTWILAAGLGIGLLTWLMMWEGMLGVPFQFTSILLPYLILCVPGTLLWWRGRSTQATPVIENQSTVFMWIGRIVVIVVGVAVLLNAVYWPFYKADALGIYADQAHFMYATRGLIPMSIVSSGYYQAYPMLVQLGYTFTYLASGWENPYLAKVIPTLLGLACLGAVYYLGKELYDGRTGWLAVLLLIFAPLFGRWASSGYADLPMAFYYTLAALFAWRMWKANSLVDALMSGIAAGLGAWTKNAMLPALVLWFVFLAWGLIRKRISFKLLLVALVACGVVAAPWYVRNLLEAHLLMPATVWTDQAAPNLSNLLVFITHPENLGFTGWLILIGIILAVVQVIRHLREADREILLLVFTLPYFAVWWLLTSYDRRFLLYFLPIFVVLAAACAVQIWGQIPQRYQRVLSGVLTLIALGMTVYIASISVDYKIEMLRNPLMSDAAKHQIVSKQPSEP